MNNKLKKVLKAISTDKYSLFLRRVFEAVFRKARAVRDVLGIGHGDTDKANELLGKLESTLKSQGPVKS